MRSLKLRHFGWVNRVTEEALGDRWRKNVADSSAFYMVPGSLFGAARDCTASWDCQQCRYFSDTNGFPTFALGVLCGKLFVSSDDFAVV